MTSPSRRKRPTTVQNILAQAIQSKRQRLARFGLASLIAWGLGTSVQAQQPQWTPEPFVPRGNLQPISQAPVQPTTSRGNTSASNTQASDAQGDFKPAVVLRWKKSSLAEPAQTKSNSNLADSPSMVVRGGFHHPTSSPVVPAQFQLPQQPATHPNAAEANPAAPILTPPTNNNATLPSLNAPAPERMQLAPAPVLPATPTGQEPERKLQLGQEQIKGVDDSDAAPAPPNPFPSAAPQLQDRPSTRFEKQPRRENAASSGIDINCDKIRDRALSDDISKINLDISPRFAGSSADEDNAERKRQAFAEKAPIRQWYDHKGQFIIDGRLVNLTRGQVVIETTAGTSKYLWDDLSESDKIYIAEAWQLPVTCSLTNVPASNRNFADSDVQWRASGLCHKPLYFEEVQLERYGHEIGPVLQPVVSSAHFFANIAVLPYKMGIHPANECQYALGYYRPGDCAPWTVGPVPLSLRGGIYQAAAVTGVAAALP